MSGRSLLQRGSLLVGPNANVNDPALSAAYVALPSGGSDGQALVKSGTDVTWGTVSGSGGGLSYVSGSLGSLDQALMPFRAARGGRSSSPVNLVHIGDSTTEGNGATVFTDRWQGRLADALRARFPVTGVSKTGGNYYPAYLASPTIAASSPWAITGSPVKASDSGLGNRNVRLTSSAPGPLTATFSCSRIVFRWLGGSSGTSLKYRLDGGSWVTIDVGSNGGAEGSTAVNVTPGSHTIDVAWNAGGTANFEGAEVYWGDETTGWHSYDWGHSGWQADTFLVANALGSRTQPIVAALAPSLVTIELGEDDQNNAITPSAFQTNLTALIAAVRAPLDSASLARPTFVLIANPTPGGSYTYPWSQYVAAMKAVAAADSQVLCVDLTALMPAMAVDATGLGLYYDGGHPNAKGYGVIADALLPLLAA